MPSEDFPNNEMDPKNEIEFILYSEILVKYSVDFDVHTAIEKTRETWYGIVKHIRKVADSALRDPLQGL